MLGVIEQLDDTRIKHQACQFLRRSLNETIQRIEDSILSVKEETTELEITVTEQRDTQLTF
jgi:hypothetical protein